MTSNDPTPSDNENQAPDAQPDLHPEWAEGVVPEPVIKDEFTELTRKAQHDPEAQAKLWEAVHSLENWYLLPRLNPGDTLEAMSKEGRRPGLMGVRMGDKSMIPVFTSSERAQQSARDNGITLENGTIPVLTVPRAGAVGMLCGLPGEVFGAVFNHNKGEHAFYAPLENIAAQEEWHNGSLHPGALDRFVRAVAAAKRPDVWIRLQRHLLTRQHWFMISDPEHTSRPVAVEHDGAKHLLLFTEPQRVPPGARALGNDTLAESPLISAEPTKALDAWKSMHERSGNALAGAVFNFGTTPFRVTLDDMLAARDASAQA